MSQTVVCPTCTRRFAVPEGYPRERIGCKECRTVFPIAEHVAPPSVHERPAANRPAQPVRTPGRAPVVVDEDDEELTGYDVPPEPERKQCTDCGRMLDAAAAVCVHCGFNFATGERAVRTYHAVERSWEWGWPLSRRLAAFMALLLVNVATTAVLFAFHGAPASDACGFVFFTALQAFLVGTYDRIDLTRNRKGTVRITRTWRVAFISLGPKVIPWKEYEGVTTGKSHELGLVDYWMWLCWVPTVVGAIAWWWLVIRPDRAYAALCKDHGFPDEYLYRGLNQAQAQDIADTVREVTGLPDPLKPVRPQGIPPAP